MKSLGNVIALAICAALLAAAPSPAQIGPGPFSAFPTQDPTDGRFMGFGCAGIATFEQGVTIGLAAPADDTVFNLNIFDGDTGGIDGSMKAHWDVGTRQLVYTLYADPLRQGSTAPANLIATWFGNDPNPTSGPTWTASAAKMPDNDWWAATITNTAIARSPSGNYFYNLEITLSGTCGPTEVLESNIKVAASSPLTFLMPRFGLEAGLRQVFNDGPIIYPGTFPPPGGFVTAPTTYDGTFEFFLNLPPGERDLRIFDGDLDFGTSSIVGVPSGTVLMPCVDFDDPDTPFDYSGFPFSTAGAIPEGLAGPGSPADDSSLDIFRRGELGDPGRVGCVRYEVTDPLGTVYRNDNPSGNFEWEQFRIATPSAPSSGDSDYVAATDPLPSGIWKVKTYGLDLSNVIFWFVNACSTHSTPTGLDPACPGVNTYLLGDTVWLDANGNGVQDTGEPGIPGVKLELLKDISSPPVATVLTGDTTSGNWAACVANNTGLDQQGLYCLGADLPGQYIVRVAASNFAPGGPLAGTSSTNGGETQTNTVSDNNVLTYDFGYRGTGSIGDYVWYDANGNGLQDEPASAGLGGVKVNLTGAGPDGSFGTADDVHYPPQVTSTAGGYLFDHLLSGNYRVDVDETTLPAGLALTTGNEPLTVPLGAGQSFLTADFGYRGLGSIGDTVWADNDGSATQNGTEPGINGVTVTLSADLDGDGIAEVSLSTVTATVGGVSGRYTFSRLPAGTYTVRVDPVTLPAGSTQTFDRDGIATPNVAVVALAAAENRTDVDFGYKPKQPVKPILECVAKKSDGTFTAYFGYQNDNSSTVNIPVGSNNKFSPSPQDRGQPTSFAPGRSTAWPNAAFGVNFTTGSLVWTLDGGTATATCNSTPCARHVFIEKKWLDSKGKPLSGKPSNLPSTFKITATSSLGTATCTYPGSSSQLTCVYDNDSSALDDNGLWVAENTTYTVSESGLPSGASGLSGLGSYLASGSQCVPGRNGIQTYCTHTVRNLSSASACASKAEQDPVYGPDDSVHALWLPGIGTDFVFSPNGSFVTNGNGTARLTGTIRSSSNTGNGFLVDVTFSGYQSTPPAGNPKKELKSGAYVENGGPISTTNWYYYTSLTGTLTGTGNFSGAKLQLVKTGPAFQVGVGANGKNLTFGGSGWFLWTVTTQPTNGHLQTTGQGDFNIDLFICPSGPANPGTGTYSYWKSYPDDWPCSQITVGGINYSKTSAINWMKQSSNGDKTISMFRQLVSAKLNVLIGNDSSCISSTISSADSWMASHHVGSDVSETSSAWYAADQWYDKLEDYNNGELCAPPRD